VEVAAVVKAGEEIREPAAQELRAIRGVLQADRGDEAEMGEEVRREIGIEAERIAAREREHALHLFVPAQRNERDAAHLAHTAHRRVNRAIERPEPRLLE